MIQSAFLMSGRTQSPAMISELESNIAILDVLRPESGTATTFRVSTRVKYDEREIYRERRQRRPKRSSSPLGDRAKEGQNGRSHKLFATRRKQRMNLADYGETKAQISGKHGDARDLQFD